MCVCGGAVARWITVTLFISPLCRGSHTSICPTPFPPCRREPSRACISSFRRERTIGPKSGLVDRSDAMLMSEGTRLSRRAQAHGGLHFFPPARPRRLDRHGAALLLPVAFNGGGLIHRFDTSPSDMSIASERSTSPLFGPTALSLQKLEIWARDWRRTCG